PGVRGGGEGRDPHLPSHRGGGGRGARGDGGPARPGEERGGAGRGGGAADVQDRQGRHHRRLFRPVGGDPPNGAGAGDPRRRRGVRRGDRVAQALQGR